MFDSILLNVRFATALSIEFVSDSVFCFMFPLKIKDNDEPLLTYVKICF